MPWLTLAVWLLVAAIALPLGGAMATGRFSLGVQAMAAVAGLALAVLYAIDHTAGYAWGAAGAAAAGAVSVSIGAAGLLSDSAYGYDAAGSLSSEVFASMAGILLPFYFVAGALSAASALIYGSV